MSALEKHCYQVRVSSVLNKEVSSCGKQLMFDGVEETCWCSDQGSPQWVAFSFKKSFKLESLQIQFQGGFVGKDCQITMSNAEGARRVIDFYPEDINTVQNFNLDSSMMCDKMTVNFNTSTDFFGRIVIYKLDIFGKSKSEVMGGGENEVINKI